ncbi:MAG: integrin alpha [Deltaproteobacteria bacterium]|nr:integrin alpha [Deltaproteobacteria bacterium]
MGSCPVIPALVAALACACSAYDFFGYEDNSPLHVVSRPGGYPTVLFGSEIAPTSTADADPVDLVAVSGGSGTPTVFYKLAEGSRLVNVGDPWDEYLDKTEADTLGSGASLAGLPVFGDDLRSGCVAIGEPAKGNVHVDCEEGEWHADFTMSGTEGFGRALAPVPPVGGGPWLLAAAAKDRAWVFSSAKPVASSSAVVPDDGEVVELAAGRVDAGRFYLAVATKNVSYGWNRVHVYVQGSKGLSTLTEAACLSRSADPGFGGVMATGDLNGDGADELVVADGAAEKRKDVAYVYVLSELVAAAPACEDEDVEPAAVVKPGEADGPDATCEEACGFGLALAVGDLATDDKTPELAVGAPGAAVGGKGEAGAVYVYRGAKLGEVAGIVADSSPESGQLFGGGVAVAPMAGRAELLAGATGKGKLFIAFCTGVGEDLEAGADVTTNAGGKVISTRCRP